MSENNIGDRLVRIETVVEYISQKVDGIIYKMDRSFITKEEFEPYKENIEDKILVVKEKILGIQDESLWLKRTVAGTVIGLLITAGFAFLTK